MKPYDYNEGNGSRRLLAGLAALLLSGCILLLVPLTFWLQESGGKQVRIRTVDTTPPPPPPPPPPPEPPQEKQEASTQPKPEIQRKAKPLTLAQLDVALNTDVGDALAGAFATGSFSAPSIDTAREMRTFEVSELDREPRLIERPRLIYPPDLRRSGITGTVLLRVVIDETGMVVDAEVLSSGRPAFADAALEMAREMRFESPTRNGIPVRASYELPVRFQLR